jgi:alpha/beta superfamily hydrolase
MAAPRLPTSPLALQGPAGLIDCLVDWPAPDAVRALPPGASGGLALVGHPHPLYGGTRDNKVAATMARAFAGLGWVAVRPNFRGVGASAGVHDHGQGETDDFHFLAETLPTLPALASILGAAPALALAGFSFGSFVAASCAQRLVAAGTPVSALVLVGTAAGKWPVPSVPPDTLVIHGERDDTIPIADVLPWALASQVPVVTLPGADHFFHRRLTRLKFLIQTHLAGRAALGWTTPGSADD